jgi:serine/threonine protein kinase
VTLPPGTRLGPYVVDGLLGEGGMGTVYLARDTRLDRQIALKFVLDAFVADRDRTARFAQEARTAARDHDHRPREGGAFASMAGRGAGGAGRALHRRQRGQPR